MSSAIKSWLKIVTARGVAGVLYRPSLIAVAHSPLNGAIAPGVDFPRDMRGVPRADELLAQTSALLEGGRPLSGLNAAPDGIYRVRYYALGDLVAAEFELAGRHEFVARVGLVYPHLPATHLAALAWIAPVTHGTGRLKIGELADAIGVGHRTARRILRKLAEAGLVDAARTSRGFLVVPVPGLLAGTWGDT